MIDICVTNEHTERKPNPINACNILRMNLLSHFKFLAKMWCLQDHWVNVELYAEAQGLSPMLSRSEE